MQITWEKRGNGYVAELGAIKLFAAPNHTLKGKAARGTTWRSNVSIWNEQTRTLSRYGSDAEDCETAHDAMRQAESIYNNERLLRKAPGGQHD